MGRILKKIFIGFLVIIAAFFVIDFFLGDPSYVPEDEREYIAVTVDQLYEELDENPLRAKDTYTGAYVELTGWMRVIDSDGDSISLYPLEYETLDGINCKLMNDEQREKVKEFSKGDTVTVKGKITEVDDVFRYELNIDSIE